MNTNCIQYVILVVVLILLSACSNISEDDDAVARELLTLERDFLDKEFALDTAYLAYLMDSTFIGISESGAKGKSEELIAIHRNIVQRMERGIVLDSFRLEDEVVNIYSNSAVVTFVVHSFRHSGDTLVERRTRFYDVWTKRRDNWKLVASQGTLVVNID